MKQLIYYVSIIFCCVACEAKLTDYPYATVSINVTVEQNSFFFEGITSLQNDEILERGFVLLIPRRKRPQGYADEVEIYQYKVVLQPHEQFKYRLQGGWKEGTSCEAYAYIQTSNGYYRSPIKALKTPAPSAPVIRRIEVSNGEYGTLILTIIGSNFADDDASIQPCCNYFDYMMNQMFDLSFNIVSAKPDTLILETYTNASGELPFELTVNGLAATSKSTFIIPAPVELLSIEPQYPRCGESVILRMEGLKKEDFHWLYLNGYAFMTQDVGPLAIEEVEDNLIRFRLYTTIDINKAIKEGNLFVSTKSSPAISTILPIKFSFPWERIGLLKYGIDYRGIGHNGKIYWGDAYKLVAYDIATAEYEVYNFPDKSPDWWCESLVLCVLNDYIYIYEPNEYYKDNRLLRFHTKTKKWEALGYLPNTPTWGVSAVILNNKQIYINLGNGVGAYSFDTETNVLREADRLVEGYYVKYVGTYDNYVYYKGEDYYSIYRKALNQNTGEELVFDANAYLKGGSDIGIMDIVMADRYIYFVYGICTFRIDVSSADLSIESLGTAENNLESWYLVPTQEGIYAIDHIRMYKYSE